MGVRHPVVSHVFYSSMDRRVRFGRRTERLARSRRGFDGRERCATRPLSLPSILPVATAAALTFLLPLLSAFAQRLDGAVAAAFPTVARSVGPSEDGRHLPLRLTSPAIAPEALRR